MLSLDVITIVLLVWATQPTVGLDVCTKTKCDEECCGASTNDYSEFVGRYTFPTTPIKTFECKSEEAIAEMEKGVSTCTVKTETIHFVLPNSNTRLQQPI